MKTQSIVENYGGMSNRPEFYLGRGNNPDDLGLTQLEKIYAGIRQEIGGEAPKAFLLMVGGLTKQDDASATTFLQALYRLEENGWKNEPVGTLRTAAVLSGISERYDDVRASHILTAGLESAFSGRSGKRRSAMAITGEFLHNHRRDFLPGHPSPTRTP